VTTTQVIASGGPERRLRLVGPREEAPSLDTCRQPLVTATRTEHAGVDISGNFESRPTNQPAIEPRQVADLLDAVHEANARIAAEVDHAIGSWAAVSQFTADRFIRRAAQPTPGDQAREALSDLDPELLLAGVSVWLTRRRARGERMAAGDLRPWSAGMSA
jgi:hypothetical protein